MIAGRPRVGYVCSSEILTSQCRPPHITFELVSQQRKRSGLGEGLTTSRISSQTPCYRWWLLQFQLLTQSFELPPCHIQFAILHRRKVCFPHWKARGDSGKVSKKAVSRVIKHEPMFFLPRDSFLCHRSPAGPKCLY